MTGPAESLVCASCGTANPAGSRFCNSCGALLEAPAPPARETRKVVTVLFIDATSSTALGERLDPESLRAVMTRYFDVMREVIEFHGGSVEKFIGDAVMAVFGVPVVHEDDALRACRAALEIHDRLGALDEAIRAERGASVEWRMGINTGEVVAGDAVSGQRIVTGDAVNVAARLEGAAEPGQILLGAETLALVRGAVAAEPLEPIMLKGKTGAVPAWRLIGSQDGSARPIQARSLEARLVGRKRPLRLLEEAFREAVEERVCHLFTILGVAGVGKSRLVDEFVASLADQAQVASGRCLAYGRGITYWPVAEAIRHGAGISEEATPEDALVRIRELVEGDPEGDRMLAAIGDPLGIAGSQPAPEDTFWAIRRTFEAIARQRPLILVFDDVHWGEPTFLDLIDHIADWTRDAPILLISMARPELLETRPAWGGGKRSTTTVQLEPLSEVETGELVEGLLGQSELPSDLRSVIGHAAEGNPLFVEELLGKLIDDGFLVQADSGWAALGNLGQLAIPPTISALLAARLDGLGAEERVVIERASVEGKVFHRGAVTELAPEPIRAHVRERLTSLMRMELVRPDQSAFAGEEAYQFRHLLIRDAAYQALAKQTRSELHERFAAWLERIAGDRRAEYGEIVGYHLEQAYRYRSELGPVDDRASDLAVRASTLFVEAGERAVVREDLSAAIDLLNRAMELTTGPSQRWQIVATLGPCLLGAGEGERAEGMLLDALAEAREAGDEHAAARLELGLLAVQSSTKSLGMRDSLAKLESIRDRLAALGDADGANLAEAGCTFTLFAAGRAGEAEHRARQLLAKGRGGPWWQEARRSVGASMVYGPTPTDVALTGLEELQSLDVAAPGFHLAVARLLVLQGQFDEAQARTEVARKQLADRGDRLIMAEVPAVQGSIAAAKRDWISAAPLVRKSYEEKAATGDRAYASTTAVLLAEALLEGGDLDGADEYSSLAVNTSSADDIASQGGGQAVQARVLASRGDHIRAEARALEAVNMMEATDYLDQRAAVLLHAAHVARAAGKHDQARYFARRALADYEAKGATWFVSQTQELIGEWETADQ